MYLGLFYNAEKLNLQGSDCTHTVDYSHSHRLVITLHSTIRFHKFKAYIARAIQKIKHSMLGLGNNKSLSCTSCFISVSAAHFMLYFLYITKSEVQ